MLRNIINIIWRRLWRHLSRTLTLNKFLFLSVRADGYRSCRLIQVFCHKYSFVFFYIIVIRLEAWLTNWLTVNLLKRKFTFFSKYQIYFILWVEYIKLLFRAAHSWKFWCFQHTRWNIWYSSISSLRSSSSLVPGTAHTHLHPYKHAALFMWHRHWAKSADPGISSSPTSVFTVCNSDKHFKNSSSDSFHLFLKRTE